MNVRSVKELSPFDRLLYFIRERESIRRKRALGLPAPWTDDEILQRYRFCNVRRMDDAVSRWLLDNWYQPHKDHPNAVPAAACARMFNRPDVLAELTGLLYRPGPPAWADVRRTVLRRKAAGLNTFNAAYVVSTSGHKAEKVAWVVGRYLTPLTGLAVPTGTMAGAHAELSRCYGYSSFMSGQVVADLRHAVSGAWADRKVWAPLGPGSARGLVRLGRPGDLAGVVKDVLAGVPLGLRTRLEAMDVQNCLCEYDKYERALSGEGKPKQLYRGGC